MPRPRTFTLCLIAETHQLHRELDMPPADVLLYAGDFTMWSRSLAAIEDFDSWLGELPYKHRIVVPGNHEFFLEADSARRSLLSYATVLINDSVEIEGLRIWGSPVTPLANAAFGMPSPADRRSLYETIPEDTDIVVTHGPPLNVLDEAPGSGYHSGCPALREAVTRIKPRLHVFGHIHGAYGMTEDEHTTYANVALLGPGGDLSHQPLVLRIQPRKRG